MKLYIVICLLAISHLSLADEEKGGWSDIKSGTMKVVRGASKGVKKVADKLDKKIGDNQKEDEDEEKAEQKIKKKR